jgi:hypothetical protein
MRTRILLFMLAACSLSVPAAQVHGQATAPVVVIMEVDAGKYPAVEVRFLAMDSNGMPIANLTKDAIRVIEGDVSVDFALTKSTIGMQAGFLADLGAGHSALGATGQSRRAEMHSAFSWLFDQPWMMSGQDTFFLSMQDVGGTRSLAGATHDSASLRSALQGFQVDDETGFSNGLAGISTALDFFAHTANEKGQSRQLIFFSTGLQTGGAKELDAVVEKARAGGVLLQTVLFRQEFDSPYAGFVRELAHRSGGQYIFYDEHGNESLRPLAERMTAFRTQYTVAYRSKQKDSGTQIIQLGLEMAGASNPAVGKYDIALEAPSVEFITPTDGGALVLSAAEPEATADAEATREATAMPEMVYSVEANVHWPDGYPRNISRGELWINGKPVATIENPNRLQFEIPPSKIKAKSGSEILLQIRVTDELGWTASSGEVLVSLDAPQTSGCGTVPAAIRKLFCPAGASKQGAASPAGNLLPFLTILAVGLAVGVVIFFRKPNSHAALPAEHGTLSGSGKFLQTMRFQNRRRTPKAYLFDVDHTAGLAQEMLALYGGVSIGRSRKHADIVLQAGNSASALSRLHCTLLEEDGEFFVRDEQSANGTYLNGTRLVPLVRNILKAEDVIELGSVSHGGVRFRFQRTRPDGKPGAAPRANDSDATRHADRA